MYFNNVICLAERLVGARAAKIKSEALSWENTTRVAELSALGGPIESPRKTLSGEALLGYSYFS